MDMERDPFSLNIHKRVFARLLFLDAARQLVALFSFSPVAAFSCCVSCCLHKLTYTKAQQNRINTNYPNTCIKNFWRTTPY